MIRYIVGTAVVLSAVLLYLFLIFPSRRRAFPVEFTLSPIAHRGIHGSFSPENSISAIMSAVRSGRPVEIDVRLTKDGVPVDSSAEQYHNNSKYYSEQSAASATASANSAANASLSEVAALASADNAHNSEMAAAQSASDAADSEDAAATSEQNAKASEQAAKASEDILQFYVDFVIPRFVIANNRLYISNAAQGEFIVANNRLYIKNVS